MNRIVLWGRGRACSLRLFRSIRTTDTKRGVHRLTNQHLPPVPQPTRAKVDSTLAAPRRACNLLRGPRAGYADYAQFQRKLTAPVQILANRSGGKAMSFAAA
jgi:hypothetical protein